MALGAMVNDPNCNVKIVPVGMSYFHPHRFRSRAVVEFGHPMDVPPELVDMFKEGGDRKREASQKMLDFIYDGLKTVTVRAPDYETLMVSTLFLPRVYLALIRRSFPVDSGRPSIVQDSGPTSNAWSSC
jgi:1-acyl-sn-glycerol-3-phosphate acyltransferase